MNYPRSSLASHEMPTAAGSRETRRAFNVVALRMKSPTSVFRCPGDQSQTEGGVETLVVELWDADRLPDTVRLLAINVVEFHFLDCHHGNMLPRRRIIVAVRLGGDGVVTLFDGCLQTGRG